MCNRIFLYPRLAATNIKNNRRFYFPYLLAGAVTVMMFFIMLTLANDPVLPTIRGGITVALVLRFGCIVIAVFAAIILFYTNSVLTKARKREFAIYNILGMEKRHIGRVLAFETLDTILLVFGFGILFGVVFAKLLQLLLLRILGGNVAFGLRFDPFALLITAIFFSAVYFVILANTLRIIHLSRPVELLRGSGEGEREPKSRWILAVLGILSLGAGYAIAVTVDDAVKAIVMFFLAVLLVIAGTYLLFTAFSIVFFKALRKNKRYYYQTRHFPTVSGMLYRMKRNAAGLASICILSTMVLVTVSTTVCLYLGTNTAIDRMYPHDFTVSDYTGTDDPRIAENERIIRSTVTENGFGVTALASYRCLRFLGDRQGDTLRLTDDPDTNLCLVWIMDAESYRVLTGSTLTPERDGVYIGTEKNGFGDTVNLLGSTYRARSFDPKTLSARVPAESAYPVVYVVVSEQETLFAIRDDGWESDGPSVSVTTFCDFSGGTEQERADLGEKLIDVTARTETMDGQTIAIRRGVSKQLDRSDYLASYGSFFFLGMFLGLLFLLATVLIIYYKQISEGYDDRERFRIMQKVGMTKKEVRSTILSQILTVFFLPILTAAVHITFAFPMIRQILILFGLTDVPLFFFCTLVTFLVFLLIYVAVYFLTARAYDRIVNETVRE